MIPVVTGTLKDAWFDGTVLYGRVYNDVHGRFIDGSLIRTSKVVYADSFGFKTLNSLYKVESWA